MPTNRRITRERKYRARFRRAMRWIISRKVRGVPVSWLFVSARAREIGRATGVAHA